MEVGTGLEMAKERPGLPIEVPIPVRLGLRQHLAVRRHILLVHELVEGFLHGVLAILYAITAIENIHELLFSVVRQLTCFDDFPVGSTTGRNDRAIY